MGWNRSRPSIRTPISSFRRRRWRCRRARRSGCRIMSLNGERNVLLTAEIQNLYGFAELSLPAVAICAVHRMGAVVLSACGHLYQYGEPVGGGAAIGFDGEQGYLCVPV